MNESAFDRALAALSDRTDPDWDALDARMADDEQRRLLRSLRDIARIGHEYAASSETAPREVPFTWGPLQVLQWIARGAHGNVYRAWDPRLERDVALKLLRVTSAGAGESTAVAEGRLLARVHHPNVVSVYGADRIDGQAGVWMEFLSGRTLREEVERRESLPVADAVACAIDICSALTAVHRAGLMHRDVKAQNIIRTPNGRTVLMDFGAGQDARARARVLEGTPVYLAPELLDGAAASPASEVYAVGVLMYFMLTGRYPAAGASIDDLKRAHADAGASPATGIPAPAALSGIVNRALARKPGDRFPTPDALGTALREIARAPAPKVTARFAAALSALTIAIAACLVLAAADARFGSAGQNGPRRVMLPPYELGLPSKSGPRYPFVDGGGQLGYWQSARSATHVVVPAARDTAYRNPIMSPDGSLLAYTAAVSGNAYELRLTDVARQETRELILRETAYEPIAADWSLDGANLLCWLRQQSGTLDLVIIAVETRDMRPLYSVSAGPPPFATLSPDGRFAVTLEPTSDDGAWSGFVRNGYLILVPVDGSPPVRLLPDSGQDAFPSWLPDGRGIFFLRPSPTVQHSHDGWIVRLDADLRPEATLLAEPNVGSETARPAYTVNAAGELQQFVDARAQEVYVAPLDAASGKAGTPTRIDPRRIGSHVGPAWSPNGASIAYFSTTPAGFSGGTPIKTLAIKDVETGRIRQVKPRLTFLGGYTPQWSRDGASVVVWGRDTADLNRTGYYLVDVLSGETQPLVVGGIEAPARSQFSPDGLHFVFNDNVTGIVSLDLVTGARKRLLPLDTLGRIGRFAISPDGTSIAFISSIEHPDGSWSQTLALFRKGMVSEVVRSSSPEALDLGGWTSDARAVLYSRGANRDGNPVFEVPPDGSPARQTGLLLRPDANVFSLSPDARWVAYAENVRQTELNIVPLAPK